MEIGFLKILIGFGRSLDQNILTKGSNINFFFARRGQILAFRGFSAQIKQI
jgi:hypothetical protein